MSAMVTLKLDEAGKLEGQILGIPVSKRYSEFEVLRSVLLSVHGKAPPLAAEPVGNRSFISSPMQAETFVRSLLHDESLRSDPRFTSWLHSESNQPLLSGDSSDAFQTSPFSNELPQAPISVLKSEISALEQLSPSKILKCAEPSSLYSVQEETAADVTSRHISPESMSASTNPKTTPHSPFSLQGRSTVLSSVSPPADVSVMLGDVRYLSPGGNNDATSTGLHAGPSILCDARGEGSWAVMDTSAVGSFFLGQQQHVPVQDSQSHVSHLRMHPLPPGGPQAAERSQPAVEGHGQVLHLMTSAQQIAGRHATPTMESKQHSSQFPQPTSAPPAIPKLSLNGLHHASESQAQALSPSSQTIGTAPSTARDRLSNSVLSMHFDVAPTAPRYASTSEALERVALFDEQKTNAASGVDAGADAESGAAVRGYGQRRESDRILEIERDLAALERADQSGPDARSSDSPAASVDSTQNLAAGVLAHDWVEDHQAEMHAAQREEACATASAVSNTAAPIERRQDGPSVDQTVSNPVVTGALGLRGGDDLVQQVKALATELVKGREGIVEVGGRSGGRSDDEWEARAAQVLRSVATRMAHYHSELATLRDQDEQQRQKIGALQRQHEEAAEKLSAQLKTTREGTEHGQASDGTPSSHAVQVSRLQVSADASRHYLSDSILATPARAGYPNKQPSSSTHTLVLGSFSKMQGPKLDRGREGAGVGAETDQIGADDTIDVGTPRRADASCQTEQDGDDARAREAQLQLREEAITAIEQGLRLRSEALRRREAELLTNIRQQSLHSPYAGMHAERPATDYLTDVTPRYLTSTTLDRTPSPAMLHTDTTHRTSPSLHRPRSDQTSAIPLAQPAQPRLSPPPSQSPPPQTASHQPRPLPARAGQPDTSTPQDAAVTVVDRLLSASGPVRHATATPLHANNAERAGEERATDDERVLVLANDVLVKCLGMLQGTDSPPPTSPRRIIAHAGGGGGGGGGGAREDRRRCGEAFRRAEAETGVQASTSTAGRLSGVDAGLGAAGVRQRSPALDRDLPGTQQEGTTRSDQRKVSRSLRKGAGSNAQHGSRGLMTGGEQDGQGEPGVVPGRGGRARGLSVLDRELAKLGDLLHGSTSSVDGEADDTDD